MLIAKWNEILVSVLAELTEAQRNALTIEQAASQFKGKVGEKNLKKYGFKKVVDYEKELIAAKERVKEILWFEYGIGSADDLSFSDDEVLHEEVEKVKV